MADKQGAYGAKAADTDFRRKWDKEEYAERAKKKDEEERERMKENDERMKQGESLSYLCLHSVITNNFLNVGILDREETFAGEKTRPTQAHRAYETTRP